MQRLRVLAATAGVLASPACTAPAAAQFTADTHEPAGDWLPRASAPMVLDYVGVCASSDPAPMFLTATRRSFAYARRFVRCT